MLLITILKDSDYKLTQFPKERIQALEDRIVVRENNS